MLALENAEEVLQILDRYTKQKSKDIPPELDEYLNYVAKTGDTVYRWPTIQYLFREKLINVIKEFHDTTASIEGKRSPHIDVPHRKSIPHFEIFLHSFFFVDKFDIFFLCFFFFRHHFLFIAFDRGTHHKKDVEREREKKKNT